MIPTSRARAQFKKLPDEARSLMLKGLQKFLRLAPRDRHRHFKPMVQVRELLGIEGGAIRANSKYRILLAPTGDERWEVWGLESRGGRFFDSE